MTRKSLAAIAAIIVFAVSAPLAVADEAQDIAAIGAAKSMLDAAFAGQDAAALKAMMTPDHVAVAFSYKGPQTLDEEIASLPALKIETYDSTEPRIKMLGSDAALVTQENSYRGTFKGNPLPQRVFSSEVWVRSDGKWLQKFYQETVIELE